MSTTISHSWRLRKAVNLVLQHAAQQAAVARRLGAQRRVGRIQDQFLRDDSVHAKGRMVVFFIPDTERVTGGRLQMFTLYRLTRELLEGTDTSAVMCWFPGHGFGRARVTSHENDVVVCPFQKVLRHCRPDCRLVLHVPEFAAPALCDDILGRKWLKAATKSRGVHVNILNQNMDSMVNRRFISSLQRAGCEVTITAAPSHWASPAEEQRMGVPIHWLPTWYYSDSAEWQPFETKRDLLIVSPDRCSYRDLVLDAVRDGLPDLEIRTIRSMPFERYTELERAAKWSITFGEGCDGYFYGPAMRGGVGFAVYNETFSGWSADEWQTLYPSYEEMARRIVSDMKSLDTKNAYEQYSKRLRERFSKYRSYEALRRQVTAFYNSEYSVHPVHTDGSGCTAGYH